MAHLSFLLRHAIRLAASGLVMVILHAGQLCEARAVGTRKPSGNVIRVWSVGSPFTGALPNTAVPPVMERKAEKLGYTIERQNFVAAGFAAKLRQAVQEHAEPEVITFDNFGVLLGVTTATGRIDGVISEPKIASSLVMVYEALAPLQARGWVILVRSAANYQAAEALAMQPPVCQPEYSRATHTVTAPDLRLAQETATDAARAYLACNLSSLSAVSDASRLGEKCFLPEDNSLVEAVEPCGVSGNQNLAFVSLISSFTAQTRVPSTYHRNNDRWLQNRTLGHQSLLAVLRNQHGVWRLLAITDDPTNTNLETHLTVQRVSGLLEDVPAAAVTPEPARLITPEGAKLRRPPTYPFGNFAWRPSPSTEVIGEVAEFLVGDRYSARERTRLFFLLDHERRLSSGRLWGALGRWRIWSIGRDGNISFSEHRSYGH